MSDRSLNQIISDYNVEVTLAIGTGKLPVEVDLEELANALDTDYDPENDTGVEIRTSDDGEKLPMTTYYTSGKYILRTPNEDSLYEEQEIALDKLVEIGLITEEQKEEVTFEVSNIACVADVGTHFQLSPLTVGLGYENAEYEPEQFPAVIYQAEEYDCTFSIFSSGRIVFPGSKSTDDAIYSLDKFIAEELDIWM